MTTATVLPGLAAGIAETVASAFQTRKDEEISADDASFAVVTCNYLKALLETACRAIEQELSQGVEAQAFIVKYQTVAQALERLRTAAEVTVANARAGSAPAVADQLAAAYLEMSTDLECLRVILADAMAKARAPQRPLDWQRVHDAEAAYARGETKPFQRSGRR